MKSIFKVYNNEAFISCVVVLVLSNVKRMDITRLFIFTSILLSERIVADNYRLNRSEDIITYIKANPRKFSSFPNMFEELIPLILNSLTLLAEMAYVDLKKTEVELLNDDLLEVRSERFIKIKAVAQHLISISEECNTRELTNTLNIRI